MRQITKYYTKVLFYEFYNLNWKLLLTIAVFSFYTSYNLKEISDCTIYEYSLLAMSDYYYFIFYFFILYTTLIFKLIKNESELIIIRTKKFFCNYFSKLLAVAVFTLSLLFLHILIAMLLGVPKCNMENQFALLTNIRGDYSKINAIYSAYFKNPVQAILGSCIFTSLGLICYSGTLMLVSHFLNEKCAILLVIISFFATVLALHVNVDNGAPYLFLINYLFFHRAVISNVSLYLFLGIEVSFFVFLLLWTKCRGVSHAKKILLPVRMLNNVFTTKNMVLFIFVILVLSIMNILKNYGGANSGLEYAILGYDGYGLGYLNVVEFFNLIIINGIPIYIISTYLSSKNSMRNMVLIRYNSKKKYFFHLQCSMLMIIIIEMLAYTFFNILLGTGVTYGNDVKISALDVLLISAVLRISELMFLEILYLLLFSVLKNTTFSFFCTMAFYLLIVLFDYEWLPFGLSSIKRMIGLDNESIKNMALTSCLLFWGIYGLGYLYLNKSKTIEKIIGERN